MSLIYTTAHSYSTLVHPIGRQHHRTWENTLLSHSKSPLKRENKKRPDSIGMRLLLPPDLIQSTLTLLETISKMATSLTSRWLDTEESLELVSQVASQIAANFRNSSSGQHPLFPEQSSVDLQVPQQLFWICRTAQELKILLIGPPTQEVPFSGSPRRNSPRIATQGEAKALVHHIHAFGAASTCFDMYWTLFEPMLQERFQRVTKPKVSGVKELETYLREVYDIMARVWIMLSLTWVDTPALVNAFVERGLALTLDEYLCASTALANTPNLQLELPMPVPQLCVFSLPHVQVEQLSLRFAGIIDRVLQPVYDLYSRSSPSFDDAMASLSQLNLFWANARSGPWLALAKSGFSAPLLILRFLPAVQSIRSAASLCASLIEHSSTSEKAAYHDLAIWTQPNPSNAWFGFLTSCLCMMVCCPGLLSVEDFLLDSLSTPLTNSQPELAMTTYARILQFISFNGSSDSSHGSFWTQEAIVNVLDTLKLGSIKTVLQLRLQDLLKPKPATASS